MNVCQTGKSNNVKDKIVMFIHLSCDRLLVLFDFAREESLYNCIVGVNCKACRQVCRVPNGFVVIFLYLCF